MVGGILLLAVAYLYVRRLSRPRINEREYNRHPTGSGDDAMLSQDPAEALRRLTAQHRDP